MEKQNTKIIKDQKQTRTTIPAKLVKEAGVETGHVAEWELKDGKLNAEIISHKDFMKKAAKANSLPAQTEKALGPESEEDKKMYANCEGGENGK